MSRRWTDQVLIFVFPSLFKDLLLLFYMNAVSVWVPLDPEEDVGFLGARVRDSGEPTDVGAENQT